MIDLSSWPALVLAAGLGTRLRPLSNIRAKAAMPVAGQPIISRILRWLRDAGVRRVVLNLHHRPETITRIVGDGAEWGLEARYSWEMEVLGSAGGPKLALPLLDAERFLIVNGDTLTDCDLRAVAGQHVRTDAMVTMAFIEKDVDRFAIVDRDGAVRGFGDKADVEAGRRVPAAESGSFSRTPQGEKDPDSFLHFIGVQAVSARAFDDVPEGQPYETVKQLYLHLIERHPGSVRAYRSPAEFLDVGTPADYLETVDIVARREGRDLDRGAGTIVDLRADVRHSVLWDRVRVEGGAELIDCIVGDDVVIPAGARYTRSAIVNGARGLLVSPF